ncbi:MAG: threonine synthase, partial [Clostridiales bacterium]|nr:threonine synthase [Clostridiales bacterium]
GKSPAVTFPQAVLDGIAPDGGLYVPDQIPRLKLDSLRTIASYAGLSQTIFEAMLPGYSIQTLKSAAQDAYGKDFFPCEVTPLIRVGENNVLELFHGPTAAFKDVALSVLPNLMAASRKILRPDSQFLILTATSGDTGSAAMRGFADIPGFQALIFYPVDGISEVQKAQMKTMPGNNVDAVGIRGNFDDAQSGVKRIFQSAALMKNELPHNLQLSSANSINIGRLVPQIVYYFKAYNDLLKRGSIASGEKIDFSVPTGNFGDILAGYIAREMGLPIGLLICASNSNRVLTDFLKTGLYDFNRELLPTLSPSMDILISSNLERLLYMTSGTDAQKVSRLMADAHTRGAYQADDGIMKQIKEVFVGVSCTDEQALLTISRVFKDHGYLLDPHTAAAWHAMDEVRKQGIASRVNVVLSTASPFKFPGAMLKALGEDQVEDSIDLPLRLEEKTSQRAPACLRSLAGMQVLHDAVISKQEMEIYTLGRALKW